MSSTEDSTSEDDTTKVGASDDCVEECTFVSSAEVGTTGVSASEGCSSSELNGSVSVSDELGVFRIGARCLLL
jgi:hypothetical protein